MHAFSSRARATLALFCAAATTLIHVELCRAETHGESDAKKHADNPCSWSKLNSTQYAACKKQAALPQPTPPPLPASTPPPAPTGKGEHQK